MVIKAAKAHDQKSIENKKVLKFTCVLLALCVIAALICIHGQLSAFKRRKRPMRVDIPRRPQPRKLSKQGLVRICTIMMNGVNYVDCIGVYVDNFWVMASVRCSKLFTNLSRTFLLMGSDNMDCTSGHQRKIKDYFTIGDSLLLQLRVPFTLGSKISTVELSKGYDEAAQCYVYCNTRSGSGNETLGIDRCGFKITHRQLVLNNCSDGKIENSDARCGYLPPQKSKGKFDATMSPIICGNRLLGFVENYQDKTRKVFFNDILSEKNAIWALMSSH